MLTIIIHDANFQPRVMYIRKEYFPEDMYNILKNNSVYDKDSCRNILIQPVKWKGHIGKYIHTDFTSTVSLLSKIIEYHWDPNFQVPEWSTKCKYSIDHGFFNSAFIKTKGEVFEVIEDDYVPPMYDSVTDMLKSY